MTDRSNSGDFWDAVDSIRGTGELAEVADSMSLWLAGVSAVPLTIAALQAVREAIAERHAKGDLLVLEAEAIARTLPLAYTESLAVDCSPHRSKSAAGAEYTVSPLIDNWVADLAGQQSDADRIRRVSEIAVTILDDRYVKTVGEIELVTRDLDGIIVGLTHLS